MYNKHMKQVYKSLSDIQKKNLGIIIKYFRKKEQISQEEFIRYGICSRTTLSAIENGKIIKQDMIYYEILSKLDILYIPDNVWEEKFIAFSSDLLDTFLEMNDSKINEMSERANLLFLRKKGLIYYEQLFLAIKSVFEYLYSHKSTLTEVVFYEFLSLIDIYPSTLQILVLHLCFLYCNNQIENFNVLLPYIHLYKTHEDHILIKVDKYIYDMEMQNTEALFSNKTLIERELTEKEYWEHFFMFKSKICFIETKLFLIKQKENYYAIFEQIMNNEIILNDTIKKHVLRNLATLFFSVFGDYEKTYEILEILKKTTIFDYGNWYELLYIVCSERTNRKVHVPSLKANEGNEFLYYYHLKYNLNKPVDLLIDYIMYTVLPLLKMAKFSQLVGIFERELEFLLDENGSKRYKDYYDFKKATKK